MFTPADDDEYPTLIHRIFHDPHSDWFKAWTFVINTLIYLSCIAIALESVESIEAIYGREFSIFEWVSVGFFTLDYVGNIYTAKNRVSYIFSFWGFVDLLSILPTILMLFNFSSIKAAKLLRLLRVIRALRVLKLARAAMQQVDAAKVGETNRIAANLRIYLIALFSTLMISSTLMYYIEGGRYTPEAIAEGQAQLDEAAVKAHKPAGSTKFVPTDPISGTPIPEDKRFFISIPEAMWWSIVTLTTTGYGDLYPVTIGGRIVAGVTMLLGLVLFGILMNIIGRTLMVLLFGEQIEAGDQPYPAGLDRVQAALLLLAEAGILSQERAAILSGAAGDRPAEEPEGKE